MTHADPQRRVLDETDLRLFRADGCPPDCRVCGKPLAAGDYYDPFHPYDHSGNLHRRCADQAPARRSY